MLEGCGWVGSKVGEGHGVFSQFGTIDVNTLWGQLLAGVKSWSYPAIESEGE